MSKFDELEIPAQWQQYWSKYPKGYSMLEAVIDWVNQTNDMVTNVNSWNDYLDNFVADWDKNLQEKTGLSLQEFIDDGTLGALINDGLLADVISKLGAKANQSAVDIINSQISTLLANSGNSSASASEIQDGRLTTWNETLSTLGVRNRMLDDFASYTRSMTTDYTSIVPVKDSNNYVDKGTLVLTAHSGYVLTVKTDCQYNDEYLVTTAVSGPLVAFAVLYDTNKNIIGVAGPVGDNTTNFRTAVVRVNNVNAKYIAFQVNASQQANMLIRKKKPKSDTVETLKRSKGYYHVNAKPRTGMTDRAQIWLTYDIGTGQTVNSFNIPFEIISNVSGLNYRLFAGLTTTTYEMTLENYSTWIGEGTYNWLTTGKSFAMPNDTTSGNPTRYFHVFLDVILTDVTKAGEINVAKFKINGKDPIKALLNLYNAGDMWGDVAPYAERSPLYKKKMAMLGTSLTYGSTSGNDVTWCNKLGKKYDMTYYNYGDNGDTVANQTADPAQPCMANRWNQIPTGLDYFILEGGANDYRLNVPLGTVSSTDKNTFMGAINVILNGIRASNPRAKMLLLTNWDRNGTTANSIGLTNLDYVNAMISVANAQGVQYLDNYHNSGIRFNDPVMNVWQDEGLASGSTANFHISDEAYTWILPQLEMALQKL